MSNHIHAFDYLGAPAKHPAQPLCILFGNEAFLKRHVLHQLRDGVLESDEVPYATLTGSGAEWRDVSDELATVSLFGGSGPRLVVVEDADTFVTRYRSQLEDYLARERSQSVLVLIVDKWQAKTRLHKAVDQHGLGIECRPPESGKKKYVDQRRVVKWIVQWAKTNHNIVVEEKAGQLLVDLVGVEFGMLDQDLAKLALFVDEGGTITPELVKDVVGGWKAQSVWELGDAAANGDTASALTQLDRLITGGENPLGILAQLAWSYRRFSSATRIVEHGEKAGRKMSVPAALQEAGFPTYNRTAFDNAQKHLRQMGRQRAGQLIRWITEADLAMKRSHSSDVRARFLLEQMIVRLSKELSPTRAKK